MLTTQPLPLLLSMTYKMNFNDFRYSIINKISLTLCLNKIKLKIIYLSDHQQKMMDILSDFS